MVRLVILALLCNSATALLTKPGAALKSKLKEHVKDWDVLRSSTFKPVPHYPEVEEAKNVCLSIKEPCSGRLETEEDDDSNKLIATKLNLQKMPDDFAGKILPSALLVTRGKLGKIDRNANAFQKSEFEWSESMLPMFDVVSSLSEKLKEQTDKALFSAVVIPQAPTAGQFLQTSTFDADVLDSLMETAGHKADTEKLFCEDIKKEEKVCFNRLVHYRHSEKKSGKHTSAKAAEALRQHASITKTESKGRKAVLVVRRDHQGWMNFVEVEQKLRAKLEEKCWNLAVVEPANAPTQQVLEHLKDADLVLAKHGPQNEHMIWMPRKAGFIEDKNCKCSDYGYKELADQEDLHYAITNGPNDDLRECELQKRGVGICTADKPRVADFENEIAPAVDEMIELLEQDRSDLPSRCGGTEQKEM
eukprot:gnl/MRDRNA2_/MRDRNA2_89468_c0_seq1.p1 gnl/MRDRNA2_/MRDRNA2_89468_c0~~gnl/MRDRNA2_/MRDRNA2_89468_c0_seq1.p1  ORF type:complete len:418 (+),score=122.81 gnl/MRDRNA2_/MRDRNA2_89468_c0_seq1:95-1348(+)